jgi:gluconolactonase
MMKIILPLLLLFANTLVLSQPPVEKYDVDSASVGHAGVPKGELIRVTFDQAAIFPATWGDYWIYVPAQYPPDRA